ncbi:MAG: hypothetical protein RLY97_135, partial [Pseudomonadota bacterium]
EPGYYKTGDYGIRIENLQLVVAREIVGAEGAFMGFETLTHVPIDRNLVDVALLSADEIVWWDGYHAQTLAIVGGQLAGAELAWLTAQCAPLS